MSSSKAFHFQHFSINQDQCAMKVGIDGICLGAWCPASNTGNILDIGTGTGLLALMLAQRTPATIDAIEINNEASIQATNNIKSSPFSKQITIHHCALQDFKPNKKYALIISNPPYFTNALKAKTTERTLARHNDSLPLETLLYFTNNHLENNGKLALILPRDTQTECLDTAKKHHLYPSRITTIIGKEGKQPKRILLIFQKEKLQCTLDQLTIYTANGSYSEEFKTLTKDYYLPSIFR